MPSRNPEQRFADIVADIGFIQAHTNSLTSDALGSNQLVLYAVERALSRISEAASKLSGQAETLAPEQSWAQIRALGNLIRHEYDHVDTVVLWEIIETDLPSLKTSCEEVLVRLRSGQGQSK